VNFYNQTTMKKHTFIAAFFLFMTLAAAAQKVITLSVNQPPELGFSVSKQDTTINKGESIVLGTNLSVYGGSGIYTFKWSPATALNDSTLMNPLSTPSDTISYTVTVTDKNGCSFSVESKVNVKTPYTTSNLVVYKNYLYATLFPNPNGGNFKIKITGKPAEIVEISVLGINGIIFKKIIIRNFNGEHTEIINLNLGKGVYILKITSEKESLSQQFIIH